MNRKRITLFTTASALALGILGSAVEAQVYRPRADVYRRGTIYRSRDTAEAQRRTTLQNRLVMAAERVDRAREQNRITDREAERLSDRLEEVWASLRNERTLTQGEYDRRMEELRDIQEQFREDREDGRGGLGGGPRPGVGTYRPRADVYRRGTVFRSRDTAESQRRTDLQNRLVMAAERVDRAREQDRITDREADRLTNRLEVVWTSLRNERALTQGEYDRHLLELRDIQEQFREDRGDGRGGLGGGPRPGVGTYRPRADMYRRGSVFRSRDPEETRRRTELQNRLVQTAERVDRAREQDKITDREADRLTSRLESVWTSLRSERALTQGEYDRRLLELREIQEQFREDRRDRNR